MHDYLRKVSTCNHRKGLEAWQETENYFVLLREPGSNNLNEQYAPSEKSGDTGSIVTFKESDPNFMKRDVTQRPSNTLLQ